jgi:D-alanyl-D-alanine carboxypeptidase
VLQLVGDGQLALHDTLESYVPGVAHGQQVTIRDLLAMRSGIANFLEDPAFAAAYDADPLMPFSPRAALDIAQQRPADFLPGQGFHYSETNYFLLGLVIERITGRPVGEVIDERIVQPLGLTSTSLPSTPAMPLPFSHGYRPNAASGLQDVTASNPAVTWTAGAMVSNLRDLRVWSRALATGALLSPELQAERLQWTTVPGGEPLNARYGLGILSLAGFLGHNGGLPGYSSIAMHLPKEGTTIVVLVNASTLEGGPADRLFYNLAALLFPERFAAFQRQP